MAPHRRPSRPDPWPRSTLPRDKTALSRQNGVCSGPQSTGGRRGEHCGGFVAKFTSSIVAVLSCFDRVLFKGHLPITNGPALEGFVNHVLKIRRCDFMAFAEEQSDTVVDHAKRMAEQAGVEYRFLQGSHRKDKLVDEILPTTLRPGRGPDLSSSAAWSAAPAFGWPPARADRAWSTRGSSSTSCISTSSIRNWA